eukprot:scaffold128103_cov31-Prasinocladus_malaysianus.AAC.1
MDNNQTEWTSIYIQPSHGMKDTTCSKVGKSAPHANDHNTHGGISLKGLGMHRPMSLSKTPAEGNPLLSFFALYPRTVHPVNGQCVGVFIPILTCTQNAT